MRLTALDDALHGRPDTGAGIAYLFDMNRVAREENFIAIYPDGLEYEWNYVLGFRGFPNTGVDDVAFLSTLVDDLAVDLSIDRDRVYIAGFSNGGFMTQRVACEDPAPYAGFATIGATLFPGFVNLCEGATPRPMLIMHGTRDVSIPWQGVQQGDMLLAWSVLDTVSFWLSHNGCAQSVAEQETLPSQATAPTTFVHRYTFEDCPPDAEVQLYAIEGGGHNLPGVPDRLTPRIAGRVNMDLHAAEAVWAFFAQHALSAAE